VKSAAQTDNPDSETRNQVIRTFGQTFADGSLIDLVASANGDQLDLLFWDGESIVIAPKIEHGGRIYQAEELPPSIVQATRLPR